MRLGACNAAKPQFLRHDTFEADLAASPYHSTRKEEDLWEPGGHRSLGFGRQTHPLPCCHPGTPQSLQS